MNFRFDRYVQNLDISDNVIESLDKTSLRDLGVISLVQLNASRNYIRETDEEAFLGQSKLQTVDLSSNSLMNIEPNIFKRNPSLDILSLSSNQYLQLPEEGPFLYSSSLRVLQLSACNLSHIPPKAFQELPNLHELYISYNKIGMLYNVQGVAHLTTLDISHNYLRDLGSDIFTALPELNHLNFSYNSLSTLNITVMPQLVKVSSSIDLNGTLGSAIALCSIQFTPGVVTTAWAWIWCVQVLRNLKDNHGEFMHIEAATIITRTLQTKRITLSV